MAMFEFRVPTPTLPKFELMKYMISDAIPIAIICYMFIISMAKLFAKKHKYKVDDNQVRIKNHPCSRRWEWRPSLPQGPKMGHQSPHTLPRDIF